MFDIFKATSTNPEVEPTYRVASQLAAVEKRLLLKLTCLEPVCWEL